MATINLTQVGSIVLNLVDGIPDSISGTLPFLANDAMLFCEEFTGNSIGSTAIAEKYQGAIVNFTAANVVGAMSVQGSDKGFTLGDFKTDGGGASSASKSATDLYYDRGMIMLKRIGGVTRYNRTF